MTKAEIFLVFRPVKTKKRAWKRKINYSLEFEMAFDVINNVI